MRHSMKSSASSPSLKSARFLLIMSLEGHHLQLDSICQESSALLLGKSHYRFKHPREGDTAHGSQASLIAFTTHWSDGGC